MNYQSEMRRIVRLKRDADKLRKVLAENSKAFDARIYEIKEEFQRENSDLISEIGQLSDEYVEADAGLRESVVQAYRDDPSSKVIGEGLSVRVNKGISYDPNDAINWAIEHSMPSLLQVHKTNFKKQASLSNLDFVTESETVSAVVSYTKLRTIKIKE